MQSVQRVVSDGTLQIVDLSISYFDRSEINVYVNAAPYTDWRWASDVEDRIIFNSPIPAGVEVLIKRTTDLSKLRHYFSKGSAFTAEALDEDLQQVLHIAQEATEASLTGDFYTDIDMHGHRVKNIGQAVDDSDALTLRQYKQDAQGAFVARNQAEQFKNEAASYAGSAQTSANNSAASAQDSLAAARSAQTYATSAAASASAAAQSEANAAASASAAAASFDAFDDRYLGAKPSDPGTDNDGNALQVGALYWNTAVNEMRVWTGASWRVAAGSLVGNADTATKLQTARTITIGNTGKSFDGSANVSWSLAEILGVGAPETAQELAGGVDLNTIQTPGFYVQSEDADAASGTNYPVATAGALVVLKNAAGVSQLYYTYGSASIAPRAFFRVVYDGSWSPWREVYHSGNLGAASETASGIVELATAAEVQAGTDNTRAVTPKGLAAYAGALSFRNRIINGKMEVSQRGTSWTPAHATVTYTLDRFLIYEDTDGSVSVAQSTDAPTGFGNSLRVTVSTADTSIGSAQRCLFEQRIEGYNVHDLVGRDFTLSFWVRSAKTGTHCVAFANSGLDRSYVAEYTVNAANTWEYKTITVPGGIPSGGTWNFQNGIGMCVRWALCAGSGYQTTAGSWATGNFIASPNQVNVLDTVGNIFAITGVQLERGSHATQFEHRPYGLELALCQRYCEVLYDPQYRTQIAGSLFMLAGSVLSGVNSYGASARIDFRVTKRAAPTITNISEKLPASPHRYRMISPDFYLIGAEGNSIDAVLRPTSLTTLSLAIAEL